MQSERIAKNKLMMQRGVVTVTATTGTITGTTGIGTTTMLCPFSDLGVFTRLFE